MKALWSNHFGKSLWVCSIDLLSTSQSNQAENQGRKSHVHPLPTWYHSTPVFSTLFQPCVPNKYNNDAIINPAWYTYTACHHKYTCLSQRFNPSGLLGGLDSAPQLWLTATLRLVEWPDPSGILNCHPGSGLLLFPEIILHPLQGHTTTTIIPTAAVTMATL